MGKKGKVGKSRKDKFYHLAKETGYRSRSAFKLIQLNRKFQFLQKARALVDLCAAPGGWLQVASKFMPVSSLIIGVDLVTIKPIPNVVTLQGDITSDTCRQALKKQLQTWKADVVLNDGAPNVGANWVHDAFSQVHLSLMALRLACDCLTRGGWFITKIFRSSDYQSLLWILKNFFKKVNSTKPQASRSESAEIFVVCQGYLAPDKIDSRFFDPRFAFKNVESPVQTVSQLVSYKKPKAEGYEDGPVFQRASLLDFLKAQNAVDFLSRISEIAIDDQKLDRHPATTNDIRECCKDIKVLGRKELRSLLSWRSKLRRHVAKKLKEESKGSVEGINLSSDEEGEGSGDEEEEKKEEKDEEEDEEEKLEQKLAELKAEELAALKRKKKQLLKVQRRQRLRTEMKMDLPGVSIADDGDTGMFSLKTIGKNQLLQTLSRGDMAAADALVTLGDPNDDIFLSDMEEEDEISLASDLDDDDLSDVRKREEKLQRPRAAPSASEEPEEEANPLLLSLEEKSDRQERDKNLWFGKGIFSSVLQSDADEKMEIKQTKVLQETQTGEKPKGKKETKKSRKNKKEASADARDEAGADTVIPPAPKGTAQDGADDDDSDSDSSDDERDIQSMKKRLGKRAIEEKDNFEVVPVERPVKRSRVLDPEGLALGTVIATSKKAARDLIDRSFNRRTFNDPEDDLPDWFLSEEKKHRNVQIPVDRATMEEYRRRQRELNARPIKKIAEAKARKRRRMLKKMEQAKKKAEAVVDTIDISEREKAAQLRGIYKKAGLGKEKRQVTYVVAKKGVGKKVRRPAGVKGQFKVVDGRMKKDMRGQKRKR